MAMQAGKLCDGSRSGDGIRALSRSWGAGNARRGSAGMMERECGYEGLTRAPTTCIWPERRRRRNPRPGGPCFSHGPQRGGGDGRGWARWKTYGRLGGSSYPGHPSLSVFVCLPAPPPYTVGTVHPSSPGVPGSCLFQHRSPQCLWILWGGDPTDGCRERGIDEWRDLDLGLASNS